MNMRKITSMTLLASLVVVVVNSVVLYIVPEGRIAHWANWTFLGLTKEEWGAQHLTVGTLFLIAGLLHIYYNWAAITALHEAAKIKEAVSPAGILVAAPGRGILLPAEPKSGFGRKTLRTPDLRDFTMTPVRKSAAYWYQEIEYR